MGGHAAHHASARFAGDYLWDEFQVGGATVPDCPPRETQLVVESYGRHESLVDKLRSHAR